MHTHFLTRRSFGGLLLGSLAARCLGASNARTLGFRVDHDGFGDASPADIAAVAASAAGEIWKHCPNTRFDEPGFRIYHARDWPITDFDHTADGRISIGLACEGTRWAQMGFQFAHEFCHALAGHSNDWRRLVRASGVNMWLEESLCETASLFALRAMAVSWQTAPPYPNWKGYAPHLTEYARDRLEDPLHRLPAGKDFRSWFREEEASMRANAVLRDKNSIVAQQLLPLFEAAPEGWESVATLRLGDHQPDKPLERHFTQWRENAPAALQPFVAQIERLFLS